MNEKWMSRGMRKKFKAIRLHSFESARMANLPDLFAIVQSFQFWIELKCVPNWNNKIPFRKGQPEWIEQYEKDGGRCLILVLSEDASTIFILHGPIRQIAELKLVHAFGRFGVFQISVKNSVWPGDLERALLIWIKDQFPQGSPQEAQIKTILLGV